MTVPNSLDMKIKLLSCSGHSVPSVNEQAKEKVYEAFRKFGADTHLSRDAYVPPKVCSYIFEALKDSVRGDPIYSTHHNPGGTESSRLKVQTNISDCSPPNFEFVLEISIGDVDIDVSVRYDFKIDI